MASIAVRGDIRLEYRTRLSEAAYVSITQNPLEHAGVGVATAGAASNLAKQAVHDFDELRTISKLGKDQLADITTTPLASRDTFVDTVSEFTLLGRFDTLSAAFLAAVDSVLTIGRVNTGRGRDNIEIPMFAFVLDNPRARLIDVSERHANVPFIIAETLWQLTCRNDVEMLQHYAPNIGTFSPDGRTFTGSAYGPRLFGRRSNGSSQWDSVLDCLRWDRHSRRAVMTLLEAREDRSINNADMTCTLGLHFLVRGNRLDLVANMRSNDIMRGLASDVFLFTMIQEMAATELGLDLGTYTHVANIGQIYAPDRKWAYRCQGSSPRGLGTMNGINSDDLWADVRAAASAEEGLRKGSPVALHRISEPFSDWVKILLAHSTYRAEGRAHGTVDWVELYSRLH